VAPRNDGQWIVGPRLEGVSVSPGVADNDRAQGFDVRLITAPRFARDFTLNTDGSYTWLPVEGYSGGDSFQYQLTTSASDCVGNVGTVTIPPMTARLYDDTYTLLNDRVYTTPLVCSIDGCGVMLNDRAPKGTIDWFAKAPASSMAVHVGQTLPLDGGAVTPTDDFGGFRFAPTPGFVGTTTFYYSTTDLNDVGTYFDTASNAYDAKVTVNIIAPPPPSGFFTPVALDDSFATDEDTPLSITPSSLLANDPGATFIGRIATQPAHGSLSLDTCTTQEFSAGMCIILDEIQAITYTPQPNFHGLDSFRYEALNPSQNASGVGTATVTLVVDSATDVPAAVADQFNVVRAQPTVLRVLDNDLDPDDRIDPSTVRLESFPDGGVGGTLTRPGDGTFIYTPDGSITHQVLSYAYFDLDGHAVQGNLTIDVLANPAADDSYTMNEDTVLDVSAANGVLANDTGTGTPLAGESGLTLRADGSFTYMPAPNFVGTKVLVYFHDFDSATITITVNPVADAPVVVLNAASCPSICPNDPDPDDRDGLSAGSTARLRGFVADPERDFGTLTVDWGDGETSTQLYPCAFGDVFCVLTGTQTWFVPFVAGCGGVSCDDGLFFDFGHQYTSPPVGGGLQYTITVTATSTVDGMNGSRTTRATLADGDADLVGNGFDNCADQPNPDQADFDGDAVGDACDPDDDNDTVEDGADNCQFVANADQANNDGDAAGDACDPDDDNDTVEDGADNCQFVANADQADFDGDAVGDACDPDDDNDGLPDETDACDLEVPVGTDVDNDGCTDTISGLRSIVQNLPVEKKVKNPLLSKLGDAEKAIDRGKTTQAEARLSEFIAQAERLRGRGLPTNDADLLTDYARSLIALI